MRVLLPFPSAYVKYGTKNFVNNFTLNNLLTDGKLIF